MSIRMAFCRNLIWYFMHPMLNTAVKAARRAGALINRASLDLERLQVAKKGPRNYVTQVDQAVEEAVMEMLRTAYPDHGFLGEESGLHPAASTAAATAASANATGHSDTPAPEYQWVIDPLDGTTNFIHGFPNYAVSIALLHKGQAEQAVIFDPTRNELFTASRGGGAFLNDRRMRVSNQLRYQEALIGAHVPGSAGSARPAAAHPSAPPSGKQADFHPLLTECASARRMGSCVLDLAVACGRFDGFCGTRLKPWDMAAGSLMVVEAGGLVTDFSGDQKWMASGNILAASPKILTQMLAHLKT